MTEEWYKARIKPGQRWRYNEDGSADIEYPTGWWRVRPEGNGATAERL